MNALIQGLQAAGQEPMLLNGTMVILPQGGRVLGLYPDRLTNVFWTAPEISDPARSSGYFAGSDWVNLGGERLWISPELDVNFTSVEKGNERFAVPRAMDPGAYQIVSRTEGGAILEALISLVFCRSRKQVSVRVRREIHVASMPPWAPPPEVSVSGYVSDVSLTAESVLTRRTRPATWALVQVAAGGRILIPLKDNVPPRTFFGTPHYQIAEARLTCDVKGDSSFKLSIRSVHCTGGMLYINTESDPARLVVHRFQVRKPERYADVPPDDPSDFGHVQQIYVAGAQQGGFGELEHHAPALRKKGQTVTDRYEVWGFTGPASSIQDYAESIARNMSPVE